MSASTSWIIVGDDGNPVRYLVSQPLIAMPEGKRLSVRDVIARHIPAFTMEKGSAIGELLHEEPHGHTISVITVIGEKVEDVVALRKRMFEVAEVKKYNYSFPELPDLKSVWQRFRWFIRWLRKGQS